MTYNTTHTQNKYIIHISFFFLKDSEIDRIILPDLIQKVKVRRERIYVSYCSTIAVYAARGLELLATIHTGKVPLFDISYQGDFTVVCVDGMAGNSVRVCAESLENLRHFKYGPSIKAHEHDVTAIAVSPNNSLFATVSDGKNIRLSRMDGKLFNLLHRGNSAVSARAIAFSPNGSLIAMISSNGTGHVFEKSYSNSYTYSLSTKSLYASFKWDSAEVLIFSSDSSKIIVASKEEVRLYSVFLDRTKGYLALSQGGCYNFLRDKREGSIFVKSN